MSERQQATALIEEACANGAKKTTACDALGLSVRTFQRWKNTGLKDRRQLVERHPKNKLTDEQRDMVLATVNHPKYQDLPPCKIVPLLADEGIYIASESTFYRILRADNQLTHRQISRPVRHSRPTPYIAQGPNQVWSWDISYLPSQVRGLYFYLYMVVDIYSRKIVGFSVHEKELSDYASPLITQACLDEGIRREQLVLHADNGGPMKASTMLATLEKLGVIPSFSRPSVSNDNPYSEALFRTVKYHPSFPMLDKFATVLAARQWVERFVQWYNHEHLHSALKFVTPQQRHTGKDFSMRANRHRVYQAAKAQHPERWSQETRDWTLPNCVLLNPNKQYQAANDEFKLPEQERQDGACEGSTQIAEAMREQGYIEVKQVNKI